MVLFSGIDKNSSETLKKHVDELIQVNKIYKAHVVSCLEPGNYIIEFPHITEVLIKENLLPSGESDIDEMLYHFFILFALFYLLPQMFVCDMFGIILKWFGLYVKNRMLCMVSSPIFIPRRYEFLISFQRPAFMVLWFLAIFSCRIYNPQLLPYQFIITLPAIIL